MARKIEEIQQDYQQGALKAGHIQYQIFALQKDLEMVNNTLRDLNLEAVSAQEEAKKAEEEKSNG